jgi:tRNA dimethylallyltransferase
MVEHVEGRASLDDAAAALVRNTKRFVRRQLSWFKADPRVRWVNLSASGWDAARDEIVAGFAGG